MNYKMLQTIATITKENETLLHIIENLTGTTNKPPHKPTIIPNLFCWMHGYCIRHGHASKTCTSHATGHKEEANRTNTWGGSHQISQKQTSDDTNQQGCGTSI